MEQAEKKATTEKLGNVQRDSVQQQIYNARRKVQQGKTTSTKKQSSLIPASLSALICLSNKVCPPILRRHFGRSSVKLPILLPRPAANIIALILLAP